MEIIKKYLSRYTNHRRLVSQEIGLDGWISAKVETIKGEEALVYFKISKEAKKNKIEYGIQRDGRVYRCDIKYLY